jgi:hypothetical protein
VADDFGIEVARRMHWKEKDALDYFGEGVTSIDDCQGCVTMPTSQAAVEFDQEVANLILDLFKDAGSNSIYKRCKMASDKFNATVMPKFNARIHGLANFTSAEKKKMLLKKWRPRSVYDHLELHVTVHSVKAALIREDLARECVEIRNRMYIETQGPDGTWDRDLDYKMAFEYKQFLKLMQLFATHPATMDAIKEGSHVAPFVAQGSLVRGMAGNWGKQAPPIMTTREFLSLNLDSGV